MRSNISNKTVKTVYLCTQITIKITLNQLADILLTSCIMVMGSIITKAREKVPMSGGTLLHYLLRNRALL